MGTTRIEKVIVDVEVRGDKDLLKIAAASVAADKGLDKLGKNRLGQLAGDMEKTSRAAKSLDGAGRDVDRFSGRLGILRDLLLTLGPAAVPMGAILVPAVTGLAAQLGAFALAGGTALAAFQGVGDTLESVNKAALEPTAKNLEEARIAMGNLSPEARSLVRQLQEMRPALQGLRDAAAGGLLPGVEESLENLDAIFPRIERVLAVVGEATGQTLTEFSEGLTGPRGREFLRFLQTEVPTAVRDLGQTIGNLAGGMAELWMAFTPLNNDFSGWLLDAARSFDEWAQGLSQTQGFEEFVSYVRVNGPKVADALGAIGNAVLQIVEAMAPLGGPTLMALEAVADVIATIAGSNAGPVLAATASALVLLNRGMKTFDAIGKTAWATNIRGAETFGARVSALRPGRLAAGLAGVTVAATGVADGFGLANTATGALTGAIAGPWGAAIGGAVGLLVDLSSGSDEAASRVAALTDALEQGGQAAAQTSIVDALETDGILEEAERIGLSVETIVRAATGGKEAMQELYDIRRANMTASAGNVDPILDGLDLTKGSINDVIEKLESESGALGEARSAAQRTAEANKVLGGSFDDTASAAEQFRMAVDRAFAILDKRAALRAARDSVRAFNQELKDAPKNFRPGSAAADRLSGALDEIARSSLTAAGHLKGMDRQNYLRGARRDFIEAAMELGKTRSQAEALATRLGLLDKKRAKPEVKLEPGSTEAKMADIDRKMGDLDKKRATPSVDVDTSSAQGRISAVEQWLNSIQDELVYVDVVRRTRGVQEFSADGSLYEGGRRTFANGGWGQDGRYYHRRPMIARGGTHITWGEKETGWEAYISGKQSEKSRNVQILGEAARRFGYGITQMANGGITQRMAPSAPSVSVTSPGMSFNGARLVLEGPGFEPMVARVVEARFSDESAANRASAGGTYREPVVD